MLLRVSNYLIMWSYIKNVLIWLDQGINTLFKWPLNWIFGVRGFGSPDETISSVLGKHYEECGLCRSVCIFLSKFMGSRHCRKAIEADEGVENG